MTSPALVFVYNADSGVMNAAKDFFHKIVSPETYECNLCAVTYGNFRMKGTWRSFIDELEMPVEFLHRDEFRNRYDFEDESFPSVFVDKNGELEYFITTDEMNRLRSLEELKGLVQDRVAGLTL
ncbi:hypothetical protein EU546_04040 [Candidatus Thorarchaeota archaeon]|nr:MAG: hypothetical protein EU546_04040 [Candidatus Thorarchaeota archaeon]